MVYVKHPLFGNKHVPDDQVAAMVAQGYRRWPRTPAELAQDAIDDAPSADSNRVDDDLTDESTGEDDAGLV